MPRRRDPSASSSAGRRDASKTPDASMRSRISRSDATVVRGRDIFGVDPTTHQNLMGELLLLGRVLVDVYLVVEVAIAVLRR